MTNEDKDAVTGPRLVRAMSPELGMSNTEKMQLAVQVCALIRASFKNPTDQDQRDILQMAASQLFAPDALL